MGFYPTPRKRSSFYNKCNSLLPAQPFQFIIFPTGTPQSRLEPKKALRRLTGAGESVTIKAQREVLPIDGQPRFRLLQKSNRVPQPKSGYFFVLFM